MRPVAGLLGLPASEYGATPWLHIAHCWLLFFVPAILLHGSIHFFLAAYTGRPIASYVYCILHTILWIIIDTSFSGGIVSRFLQTVDPIGKAALEGQIFYWSADQRLRRFVELSGPLGWNRLIHVSAGLGVLAIAASSFRLERFLSLSKSRSIANPGMKATRVAERHLSGPIVRDFGFVQWLRFALRQGWGEFILCTHGAAFRILAGVGVLVSWAASSHMGGYYPLPEGDLLPVTGEAYTLAAQTWFMASLLTMVFYSGEIASRERSERVWLLVDASPVPDAALIAAKALGIVILSGAMAAIPLLGFWVTQALKGFWSWEPQQLFVRVVLNLIVPVLGFGAVAAFLQVLFNARGVAHGASMLFAISIVVMSEFKVFDNRLALPFMPFEETLGSSFGVHAPSISRLLWFDGFWLALCLAIAVAGYWIWLRGGESAWSTRLRQVRGKANSLAILMTAASIAVAGSIGWGIYQKTVVQNHFAPRAAERAERAAYERRYGHLRNLPQPKITHADLSVDLYGSERRAAWSAVFRVTNRSFQAITELHLEYDDFIELRSINWNGVPLQALTSDPDLRHWVYRLPMALFPGSEAKLTVSMEAQYRDFSNTGFHGTLARDGTVFTPAMWPRFGYDRDRELTLTGDRAKEALGPRVALPSASAADTVTDLAVNDDGDVLNWELQVTTEPGQTVVAPGQEISRSTGGRPEFHFRSGVPTTWGLHIASARYTVSKAQAGPVAIEIYHHPLHAWNVDVYAEAAGNALTELTKHWGPYPYDVVRIVEIPHLVLSEQDTAITNGNTIFIPEHGGWIHDYRKTPAFDWIQYQVARDLSRVWWGEQVTPARASGASLITEGLPALSGMLVLEAKQNSAGSLGYRSVLADRYLRQSALEDAAEASLTDWNEEQYLAAKAPFALDAVSRLIGTEATYRALAVYLERARHRSSAPYTGSLELASILENAADPEQRAAVHEALSEVAVYDLEVSPRKEEGRVLISARKFSVRGKDNRAEVPFERRVEVVHGANTATVRLRNGDTTFSWPLPSVVELDPHLLLIDRNRVNNKAEVR
jgi:ABC-2 type transport system permease protein